MSLANWTTSPGKICWLQMCFLKPLPEKAVEQREELRMQVQENAAGGTWPKGRTKWPRRDSHQISVQLVPPPWRISPPTPIAPLLLPAASSTLKVWCQRVNEININYLNYKLKGFVSFLSLCNSIFVHNSFSEFSFRTIILWLTRFCKAFQAGDPSALEPSWTGSKVSRCNCNCFSNSAKFY